MDLRFTGEIWYWRGPAPFHFVTVPDPECAALGSAATPRRSISRSPSDLPRRRTVNPVFGIVAPAGGELRWLDRTPSLTPVTRLTWVATVWKGGCGYRVQIPKGTTMAGRLMEDHVTVTAGMPVVSARRSGYGIVADIDSAQAYRVSGGG